MVDIKKVRIIGVPYHYGKDDCSRSDSPNVIRNSGLHKALERAKILYIDNGDIEIDRMQAGRSILFKKLKFLPEVLEISKRLKKVVETTLKSNEIPVVIGGDHSIAIGSLLGTAASEKSVTVIWIDTHGDFHTSKTTPSGRLHGMALALSLGLDKEFCKLFNRNVKYFNKNKVVMFGAQKFDPGEREVIVKNISLIDMSYITQHGIGQAVKELFKQVHTKNVHVSLDLDSIDRQYAPGTDMAIDGALTYRELFYMLEKLSEKRTIIGIDVVEYDPNSDIAGKTAKLVIESITTALGKRIGPYELYMDEIDPVR